MSLRGDLLAVLGDTPSVTKVEGFKEGVRFANKNADTAWQQALICRTK